ncbi:hypothetical protein AWB74_06028 [Caballeronia arvi]|uniref:Uncharacterized protein n=1 Tax=Caballeronia arvi TaxID=1777135 RepID=A0A158KLU4_9BURK|nr:hypothetical protein AWB74_06028 [Caballeronia arvi]
MVVRGPLESVKPVRHFRVVRETCTACASGTGSGICKWRAGDLLVVEGELSRQRCSSMVDRTPRTYLTMALSPCRSSRDRQRAAAPRDVTQSIDRMTECEHEAERGFEKQKTPLTLRGCFQQCPDRLHWFSKSPPLFRRTAPCERAQAVWSMPTAPGNAVRRPETAHPYPSDRRETPDSCRPARRD